MRGSISTLLFASVVSANVTIRMEGSGGPWEIEICESEFDKWIDVSNRFETQHEIESVHLSTDDGKWPGCYVDSVKDNHDDWINTGAFLFVPGGEDFQNWPNKAPVNGIYCTLTWE